MKRFLLAFGICALWSIGGYAQAIQTVNTTDDTDDGVCNGAHCSLREAINASNINLGPDSIIFNIPGAGPHVINIDPGMGALPGILDSNTVINGTSQPGNSPMSGQIILDGSALVNIADHGLVIYRSHVKVYGLQIQNFPGDGIQIFGGFGDAAQLSDIHIGDEDKGNVIINNDAYGIEGDIDRLCTFKGNYLGTDLAFNSGLGNGYDGLYVRMRSGQNVVIGGPGGERNYACQNGYSGFRLEIILGQPDWTGNLQVIGNYIGTDASGTMDLGNAGGVVGGGNAGGGIFIDGDGPMTIGGPGADANIIAFNYDGIYHNSFDLKTFNQNHWYCNTNGGIALVNGANNNITTPNSICVGNGLVNGLADPNVTIEIYDIDTTACPGGIPCQGNELIGSTTADANGYWIWNGAVTPGSTVSVLAIDAMGNVSEFSTCADYVTVSVYNTGPFCRDQDTIELFADVSGNVQNATFEWIAPGGLLVSTDQNARVTSWNRPGTYTLYVIFDDCEYPAQTTEVQVLFESTVEITTICAGESYTVNGNTYDMDNLTGTEVIENGAANGCDSIMIFDMEPNPSILGRMTSDQRVVCRGDSVEIRVEAIPGTFGPYDVIYTDGTGGTDTLFGIFNGHTFLQPVDQDLYFEVLDIESPFTVCDPIIGTSDSVFVSELAINPIVSDYAGYNVSCKGAEDGSIELNVSGAFGDVTYDWSPVFLSGDSVTELRAAPYAVTVTDEAGCTAAFDTIFTEPIGPEPIIDIAAPSCLGAADGVIWIDTVFDVVGQLMLSVDSVNFVPVTSYPLMIDTLSAGIVSLYFADDGDCVAEFRVIMPNGELPFVDAGGTRSIARGDSVEVSFDTDIIDPNVQWFPPGVVGCPTCPVTMASPPFTQYVGVFLENDEGCIGVDSVLIQVFIPKRAYIPNVFSPNGDNINDYFTIHTNEFGAAIESIIVVERGGVTVFSGRELPLNDPGSSWDGSFGGVLVNPGVYTYLIHIRFQDGQVIPFSGTVTVIR